MRTIIRSHCAHGRRVADVAHAAERRHSRVLDHVVDVGPRPQNAQRHRAHTCPVPFKQQAEGGDLTRLRGTGERRVLDARGFVRRLVHVAPLPASAVVRDRTT
ncbi:hypothetical protein [Streptomyces mirabilis]|uniref:hypothetical protein n=1 Tax=Streptomyces mirabilis TaxID=68239 RepID=UPI0036BEF7D3